MKCIMVDIQGGDLMIVVANAVLVGLSLILGIRLLRLYAVRPRPHSLWYAVGLLLVALAALPELYFSLTDQVPTVLWWLYWSTASSLVGFLSVGSAYLLSSRAGKVILAVMVALTVWVAAATLLTGGAGPAVVDAEVFRKAPTAAIKLPFLLQNIGGSMIILIGAVISFIKTRGLFAVLIALGTFVFASGGAAAGLLQYSQIFAFTQTFGILLLYAGVSLSLRPSQRSSRQSSVPRVQ